jgi:hypothetical protein
MYMCDNDRKLEKNQKFQQSYRKGLNNRPHISGC